MHVRFKREDTRKKWEFSGVSREKVLEASNCICACAYSHLCSTCMHAHTCVYMHTHATHLLRVYVCVHACECVQMCGKLWALSTRGQESRI